MYKFKEFRANMSAILKGAGNESVHFTRLGEEYEVKKCAKVKNEINLEEKIEKIREKRILWGNERDNSSYGCGCKKEEGHPLCEKHGRL